MEKEMTASNKTAAVGALPTDLPDWLEQIAEQDFGLGVSDQLDDQLLPLVTLLQQGSPQVEKRGAEYVDGAEAGAFWLRSAGSDRIRDHLDVTVCGMVRGYLEWLPSRGGFVARHSELPPDIEIGVDSGSTRQKLIRKGSGNVVEEVREFLLLIDRLPYLLPCTGTKHQFARRLQSHFAALRHPTSGRVLPAFAGRYRLTSVPESNAKGSWYGITFQQIGWTGRDEYQHAKALCHTIDPGALPDSGASASARIAPPNAA
jgi:hypothetical protein